MKYWRGYLVAAILAAFTAGFREFAQTHTKLVDMIYPYVTRMVQDFMADWSGGLSYCLWQALLLVLVAAVAASVVLMILFKWNPIQWSGWVAALVCLVMLLHTGIFGMNEFAGPIAEDIRLVEADCSDEQIAEAAVYYRDKANELSGQVKRTGDKDVQAGDLETLSQQAAEAFDSLVYDYYFSVFAGTTAPVKELGFAEFFTNRGQMGYTAAITGEAAVNPEAPGLMQPFAVCREMAYRMCIASQRDKHFGAFLACQASESLEFQYAGYIMAYRYCLKALPAAAASTVSQGANSQVRSDVEAWDAFVKPAEILAAEEAAKDGIKDKTDDEIADLLTRWHYQQIVVPSITEPEVQFDPMDESQVDLTGLPHGPAPTEASEEPA